MPAPSLVVQTTYAELLDRCRAAVFDETFVGQGTFISKTVKGRRYWYFQQTTDNGRGQKYVGPETPELLKQIEQHKSIRADERERRALVSTLIRSFQLPAPPAAIGNVIEGLEKAGVFRLRAVLVGTVAYHAYSAMFGERLSASAMLTDDIDIAQFRELSVAIEDAVPPLMGVLKKIDTTFRPIPHLRGPQNSTSYRATGGLRLDFLTPNRGPETDGPTNLPALGTKAEPLRFLDFLIREPEEAVLLHGGGILVRVPSPQRYAVHKLIVSRRRKIGSAKIDKDIKQSETLLSVLATRRTFDLKDAFAEALDRGASWRKAIFEGVTQIDPSVQDKLLGALDISALTKIRQ